MTGQQQGVRGDVPGGGVEPDLDELALGEQGIDTEAEGAGSHPPPKPLADGPPGHRAGPMEPFPLERPPVPVRIPTRARLSLAENLQNAVACDGMSAFALQYPDRLHVFRKGGHRYWEPIGLTLGVLEPTHI
jgi:hypothetical protein